MAKNFEQKREVALAQAGSPAAAKEPSSAYWRSFPRFEKVLAEEKPPELAQIESTCRQLDAILKSGSPQEKARAQAAMTAYARTLELYRQLTALRDKALLEASNSKPAPRDK